MIYTSIGECEAKILICMKEIRQMKIGTIINSRKNEKHKKENAIKTITCHNLMANKII